LSLLFTYGKTKKNIKKGVGIMKRQIKEICWKEVIWHRPFELETVYELLSHLASLIPRGPIIWEARAYDDRVHYLLGAEKCYINKIQAVFRTHGRVQFYSTPEHTRKAIETVKQLKISRPVLSLKTDIALSVIRAGLAAMVSSHNKEETVLQIVFGPSFAPSNVATRLPNPHAPWFQILFGNVGQASPESRSSIKEKAQQHGFCAAIRIGSSGKNSFSRIYDILSALKTLESAGVRISAQHEKATSINEAHVPWSFPLRLSVKELAHFLLLPAGEEELAGTAGLHPKALPPPEWYKNPASSQSRTFAVSTGIANQVQLSISPKDSLEHTILLGPTGTGKSTTMLHLALADINAGRSVLLIDPKTDLVNDILASMPDSRRDEVVVIDPSDPCPVGFNPLAFKNYRNPTLIADAVLAVLKEIFADSWGIRTQDILSGALLTLAKTDGASLILLPALLTDDAFRHKITRGLDDKIGLEPFWSAYEAMGAAERAQTIAPVMNKLRQFLLRPGLRNILGQTQPKFSLSDLFYKRRIVLVPLNKGLIGAESARLLGSLIVGLTWTLALSRASISPERRHIVSVFIDELQDYLSLPTDLSDALAQARGLGLGITMAHQYRDQLPPKIRAGIDANARNKIIFGLNSSDAKNMAAMAPELEARDFMNLPRYQIYTTFQSAGKNTGWVQGQTLPPPPVLRLAAELKARSMTIYGIPVEEVEREYLEIIKSESINHNDLGNASIGRRKLP
jgi:energy-coupling factor transporter ATP-binding protein EcfA2